MTKTRTVETPVLIVGAGPVGLTLALDLGWRGAQCMLIEEGDGTVEQPKIGMIAVRTMEFFRRWGIDKRVRQGGFPDDYRLSQVFSIDLATPPLDVEEYPSLRDMPVPAFSTEKKQRCPQHWLNPILQQAVAVHPSVDLRFRWRLDSFEQFPDHVTATVRDLANEETISIRAGYLIACDGGTSSVRNALGIEMHGNPTLSYSISVMLRMPEMMRYCHYGEAERYMFVGPEGTWGNWTVIDGRELWRLTVLGSPEKLDLASFDPQAWVRRALGRDDAPFEVLSVLPWRRGEVIADRFRSGRVILAGDSAHGMSPTGGMGMNTGVCDSVDLGWKLQGIVDGWGGPQLLESYEIERKPVATRNAACSTHNWHAWTSPKDCAAILDDTEEGARVRREVGHGLRAATHADWESWGLQLGYRYEGSPIVIPDETPATPDDYAKYVPTARPGSRAPHAWLPDARSTLDLFGREFALLCFAGAPPGGVAALQGAAKTCGLPLSVAQIDDQRIAQLYAEPMVLVRPDGHVAWRGSRVANAQRIIDTVRGAEKLELRVLE